MKRRQCTKLIELNIVSQHLYGTHSVHKWPTNQSSRHPFPLADKRYTAEIFLHVTLMALANVHHCYRIQLAIETR